MARQLTLTKLGGKAPFADGGLKLSKQMQISEIESHEKFQALFKIDDDLLDRIAGSMEKRGFDNSQPVHIWKVTDEDGNAHNYLIDGYTRLEACRRVGIETVPYYEDVFSSEEECFLHVLHLQVDRRNLAPEELLKFIEELMGSDYVKGMKGKTAKIIADTLGLSQRTVNKAINVIKNADEETREKIASGEKTINKADKEIHDSKSQAGETVQTEEMMSSEDNEGEAFSDFAPDTDSLSDTPSEALSEGGAGSPASLNFSHTDGVERPHRDPWESDEYDKRLIERYREGRKDGWERGFSDGAYSVWERIMEMLREGKSQEEIEGCDLFSDFTFSIIAPKIGAEYKGD